MNHLTTKRGDPGITLHNKGNRSNLQAIALRLDIGAIAFCACLCGAESCVDRAGFAMAKEEVLREFLDLDNGPPSHDTFSRVFRRLDPKAFSACLAG
jgi:DDE_Tnp_1-associated